MRDEDIKKTLDVYKKKKKTRSRPQKRDGFRGICLDP